MDAPQTSGDWTYISGNPVSYAVFGSSQQDASFVMRCDRTTRTVSLGRSSSQVSPQPMQVFTETVTRLLTASPRRDSDPTMLAAELPAADSLLDAMAISKGRFAIETGGERTLYLPSWAEVTRVIEDCR